MRAGGVSCSMEKASRMKEGGYKASRSLWRWLAVRREAVAGWQGGRRHRMFWQREACFLMSSGWAGKTYSVS